MQATFEPYFREMLRLAARLMSLFARSLGLPADHFESLIDESPSAMRAIDYPEQPVPPVPGQLRAGAHTDYGTLTILRQDAAPGGLEVRSPHDGRWIPIPSVPGAFVVNVGDLLARWTNDRWVSTMHRVVNPDLTPSAGPEVDFDLCPGSWFGGGVRHLWLPAMSVLGNRVLRREDPKFLTVGGSYTADLTEPLLDGAAYATYVRSTMAHATILSIDTSDAAGMPGVLAIYTGDDLELADVPSSAFMPQYVRPLLARQTVRYVGEPLAVVLTERPGQGEDAAEAVIVDYDPLPVVVDMLEAAKDETLLYPGVGTNICHDSAQWGVPEMTPAEEFFEGCDVVVRQRVWNQRVAAAPMEVRSAAAAWSSDGRLHQWVSTQHPQAVRDTLQGHLGERIQRAGGRARRRRWLRGEDRHLSGGDAARRPGPARRPAGALVREPHREHARPRPRSGAAAGSRDRRHPRRHRCSPIASPCCRTPAQRRGWAPSCRRR